MSKMQSARTAAERWGVSKMSVLRWIKAGRVPGIQIGSNWKVPEQFIEEVLAHGLPEAVAEPVAE